MYMRVLLCVVVLIACARAGPTVDEVVNAIRRDWPDAHLPPEALAKIAEYLKTPQSSLPRLGNSSEPIMCPTLPPRPAPTNIKDLRPQDIRAIGAVGDSVTTASNALSTTWLNLNTYPGISWSMGGDELAITMANFIKHYSPNLYGQSLGVGSGRMFLNRAVGGSTIQDLDPQVDELIDLFRKETNWATDWKIATIFVGGNNLCDICTSGGMDRHGPRVFENYLRIALRSLSVVPRLFVNVVHGFRYSQLHQFVGPFCSLAMPFLCTCITSGNEADRDLVDRISLEYNAVINRVAAEFVGFSDTFAVVVHPFLGDTVIPERSYISQADCFHPSGKGQRMFSIGLWNNMIEPIGQKATSINNTVWYKCATPDTLLYTP